MDTAKNKIAVIGMACRYPGANNLDEFWGNLIEGKETIKHFSDQDIEGFEPDFENLRKNPNYVKARGILGDIDKFDAEFFGMTPKEAAETDPQHRVWLETAWEAFENAGCDPFRYQGAIGVFAGGYLNTYLLNNILRDPVKLENYIHMRFKESYQLMIGNDIAYLPTKTAYQFNLKGPAINIQTACSTSLVAISQACQSLYSFESDICLAGGVCIVVPQETGYIYQEGAVASPDGHCRAFDIKGQGTVHSNGVGAVILKRLEDALSDRDMIYAVVSGWAVNNDGKNKVSYMAPGVDGQADVIMMAQSFAEVTPEQIGYVEAHGTATQLGDPIEITALKKAFSKKTDKKQFCGIGSVKSNIGHTDAAAGVASFIKTCLAAYHRIIPPTVNFSIPNKYVKFENTPFYIQKELRKWAGEKPLIMGVSSFGIGGTNAHMIIEEPPEREKPGSSQSDLPELILLSAKCEESLKRRELDLIDFVALNPQINIRDISFTLTSGRNHMPFRSYLIACNVSEINSKDKFISGKTDGLISKIAFMFPGQGAQYVSMGKDLYKFNPLFRQILDECFEIIKDETGEEFKSLIFDNINKEENELKLARTEFTQPALFSIEYALAKVLEHIDIKPDILIGHSIGEYTAACMAGVFEMQSALKIVIKRGHLMQKMPGGKMMAVRASFEKLQTLNMFDFEIAADNSSGFCTISFSTEKTAIVKELLRNNGIAHIDLNTSHAFHSASFDPILSEFREYVNQFQLKPPDIPFISCLTGKPITSDKAVSGDYWAQQLRNTVQFRNGVTTINENEDVLFLEVGPNTHLCSLVKENNAVKNRRAIVSTIGKPDGIREDCKILSAIGNMYNIGVKAENQNRIGNESAMKIKLPNYPFIRDRHWIDFEH